MDTYSPAGIQAVAPGETTSTGKRQRRSLELKRRIVEETLVMGASVARVARAHSVNANQVFYWRRLYEQGRLGAPGANASRLLPVSVAETASSELPEFALKPPALSSRDKIVKAGSIQLELRKARLRIEGNVDPAVLRLVLQSVLG